MKGTQEELKARTRPGLARRTGLDWPMNSLLTSGLLFEGPVLIVIKNGVSNRRLIFRDFQDLQDVHYKLHCYERNMPVISVNMLHVFNQIRFANERC